MNENETLQKEVQDAIKWEPLLHAAEIGVTVKNGVVSLTGTVDSYAKKMEAESAAKTVRGVKAIVENIKVRLPDSWRKSDTEIADEVLQSLKSKWSVPDDKLTVKVEDGFVTLGGELHWNYQREEAINSVKNLVSVKSLINNIKIKSELHEVIEQKKVEDALARNWTIDSHNITVEVADTTVTLTGTVHSWHQFDEAERTVWNTPGIWHVENKLTIDHTRPRFN